jgi:hypothetical protein
MLLVPSGRTEREKTTQRLLMHHVFDARGNERMRQHETRAER